VERPGLALLLWRIEQRRQLAFQHPGCVADLPNRDRLLEAPCSCQFMPGAGSGCPLSRA
jgi:hypothetical protein